MMLFIAGWAAGFVCALYLTKRGGWRRTDTQKDVDKLARK